MATLTALLNNVEYSLNNKTELEQKQEHLVAELQRTYDRYQDLLDSQKLLSSISEENTVRTLEYITGVINQTLDKIFQGDRRRITLTKELYRGRYAHINVKLLTKSGTTRDLDLQTGSGVKEVISFLFAVCLIAVRGGRKLLIMDELLSGLHEEAKKVIAELMGVFVDQGFQFVMVEYGLDSHQGNSFGKIYNVEFSDGRSVANPIPNGSYTPERFIT